MFLFILYTLAIIKDISNGVDSTEKKTLLTY